MKLIKRLLLALMLSVMIMWGNWASAQISEGGTPPSFAYPDVAKKTTMPFIAAINFDVAQLKAEDKEREKGNLPIRTGVIIPSNLNINNIGDWVNLPSGEHIWRLTIKAPKAIATMIYYDEFYIPEGGKLFIYNTDKTQVLGAYTNKTNPRGKAFTTEFVGGDELTLEYVSPPAMISLEGNIISAKEEKPRIKISGIGYGYNYLDVYDMRDRTKINESGSCMVNVNCSPEGDNWQNQKTGVVKSLTPIGSYMYLCSGTMINNTVQDLTPYLLTAHHCFYDDSNVECSAYDQIMYYFHFEFPGCNNLTINPSTTKTLVGAQKLVDIPINGDSDGALLRLNENVPLEWNVYFNGWDRSNTPSSSGVGIHHPAGDVKKISTYTAAATSAQWNGDGAIGASGAHWNVIFTATVNGHGVTEGGSSGSPLFNQDGRVIGTLTGGNSSCSNPNGRNLYGKLWYHWDQSAASNQHMKDYLDPINKGVLTLDGTYVANDNPAANFSSSSTSIYALQSITYTNYSSKATTYEWTFGGGTPNTSTLKNPPKIVYNAPGVFETKLIINKGTADEREKLVTITVTEKGSNPTSPVANFALDIDVPMKEGFDATVPPAGWTLEKPGVSSNQFIKANMNTAETNFKSVDPSSLYSALVQADNVNSVDTWLKSPAYAVANNAKLEFYTLYRGTSIANGTLYVYISTNNGTSWTELWTNGPSNTNDNTLKWYKNTVDLSAYGGQSIRLAFRYFGVGGYFAGFDGVKIFSPMGYNTPKTISVGEYISPVDLSTGPPVLWQWTFNGGIPATSTDSLPKVQYMTAGTYDVSLTVKNYRGEDTRTFTNAVQVTDIVPVAAFDVEGGYTRQSNYGRFIPPQASLNFIDKSTNFPIQWNWTFDGATPASSTAQNPQNITYNNGGEYNLSLVASNTAGQGEITINNFAKVGYTTDNIWNMQYGETGTSIYTSGTDYITGSNASYIDLYAERFDAPLTKGIVTSIDVMLRRISGTSGSLTISVAKDDGGYPGAIMQSVNLPISSINNSGYTTVTLPNPLVIDDAFFVIIGDFDVSTYKVAIASSPNRGEGKNTAYLNNWLYEYFYGQGWAGFDEYYSGVSLSLNIVPKFTYSRFEVIGERKHTRKNIDATVGNITVNTNQAWTATSNASWITINNSSGSGDGTFSFTVSENKKYPRKAIITISAAGNAYQDYIFVQQAGPNPDDMMASIANGETGDIDVTWSAPAMTPPYAQGNDIYDGAEDHPNFMVNSAGEFEWSYIDGDGAPTFGITSVSFPNQSSPMAFIAFNPNATTPACTPSYSAHTGKKYFASFGADGAVSNDWMISPQLGFKQDFTLSFWAKSLTLSYGAERLRVAYSTGGKTQADFVNVLTPSPYESLPVAWTKYTYTIPANAKYIAFNSVSDDAFVMLIDDIFIGTGVAPTSIHEMDNNMAENQSSEQLIKMKRQSGSRKISKADNYSVEELNAFKSKSKNTNEQFIKLIDESNGNVSEGIQLITPKTPNKSNSNKLKASPISNEERTESTSSDNVQQSTSLPLVKLRYDNGANHTSIGVGAEATLEVAIRFATNDIFDLHGAKIKALDVYLDNMPSNGITLKVRKGADIVHVQHVKALQTKTFVRINLTKDVYIDASQDLYIGYEYVQNEGSFVAGADSGPAIAGKGDLIAIMGSPFISLAAEGLNYNWNMVMLVEDNRGENFEMGYKIYRDNTLIAQTKELSITDKIISDKACYKATALYNREMESTFSNTACVSLESKPKPASLADLKATNNGTTAIELSWTPRTDAVSYNIYRDGNLIKNTASASHIDDGLSPGTYCYVITLVNDEGMESDNSNRVCAFIKVPLTIKANDISKSYGHADPALTYTIESGSLLPGDNFTGTLMREAGENLGSYTIGQGTIAVNDNYDITFIPGKLSIGKQLITIAVDNKMKTYGDVDPTLTYTIVSGILADNNDITGTLTREAGENVGNYSITQGTLALTDNYVLTFTAGLLNITKRAINVKADNKNKVYGGLDPALTYVITSGDLVNGDNITGTLTREAGENVGNYSITQGTLAATDNYMLMFTNGLLTINQANHSIIGFDAIEPKLVGDADFKLNASSTSGLPVYYLSSNTSVATVSSNGVVTIKDAGETIIKAYLDNNINYAPANPVQQVLKVTKGAISVTGIQITPTSINLVVGSNMALNAIVLPTDATNQSVTWTSKNTKVATVDANGVVLAVGYGTTTITVTTADGNYTATCKVMVSNVLYGEIKSSEAFSPNGDGINDYFIIENIEYYPENELTIFDYNGAIHYKAKGYQNNWDGVANMGKYKGQKVLVGTYYYVLKIKGRDDIKSFVLVRY